MTDPIPARSFGSAKKSRWFAVGALVVAGGAFALIASGRIGNNLVYYWGPTQMEKAGQKAIGATIRLGGQVVPGSIHQDPSGRSLTFEVTDRHATVEVHSSGIPPQMFRAGIGVVVEGTMTKSGVFESNRLMVSHGSQYRPPKAGQTVDVQDQMKTTTGLAGEKIR